MRTHTHTCRHAREHTHLGHSLGDDRQLEGMSTHTRTHTRTHTHSHIHTQTHIYAGTHTHLCHGLGDVRQLERWHAAQGLWGIGRLLTPLEFVCVGHHLLHLASNNCVSKQLST